MSDKEIHDLATAYAMAKLLKSQQEHPENTGYSEEIRAFLKSYYFALNHIPEELKEIDISTLV